MLHFLQVPRQSNDDNLLRILSDIGKQISTYAKEYFNCIVTSNSKEGLLTDLTLYILAPEIKYEYRAIEVRISRISGLTIIYNNLVSGRLETYRINQSNGTKDFQAKLDEIMSSDLFNASLRFLVDQIHLKRQMVENTKEKIVIGHAKTATLDNGEKISVGFHRIEGDEVIYYTGKGLRDIFGPNMNEEEQHAAQKLQSLSEEELIAGQYMERRKISDFENIE